MAQEFSSEIIRGSIVSFVLMNKFVLVWFDDDIEGLYTLDDVPQMINLFDIVGEDINRSTNSQIGEKKKSSFPEKKRRRLIKRNPYPRRILRLHSRLCSNLKLAIVPTRQKQFLKNLRRNFLRSS